MQAAVVLALEVQSKLSISQLPCAPASAFSSFHVAASSFIHTAATLQVPVTLHVLVEVKTHCSVLTSTPQLDAALQAVMSLF